MSGREGTRLLMEGLCTGGVGAHRGSVLIEESGDTLGVIVLLALEDLTATAFCCS